MLPDFPTQHQLPTFEDVKQMNRLAPDLPFNNLSVLLPPPPGYNYSRLTLQESVWQTSEGSLALSSRFYWKDTT